MYLQKADYKSRIQTSLLDVIIKEVLTDTGEDILQTVSKIAEDTLEAKCGVLYDIMPEFAKQGLQRNYMIFSLALDIAVYELYQRIDDEQIPEKAIKNYNDAFVKLDKISNGKSPLKLPPKPIDPEDGGSSGEEGGELDGNGLRRFGSKPKRTHDV
jgi:hypothetical protein